MLDVIYMKSPLKLSSEPKRVSAFEYQTEIVLGFDDFGESMNPLKSFLISESPQYSNPSRDIKYSKGSTGSILMIQYQLLIEIYVLSIRQF